jgi:DNA-binding transcriptional ArsR family regulator
VMTRFGVMKHLKALENAGVVVTRRSGREKLHFLNAIPIRMIHDWWIDKYREREVCGRNSGDLYGLPGRRRRPCRRFPLVRLAK